MSMVQSHKRKRSQQLVEGGNSSAVGMSSFELVDFEKNSGAEPEAPIDAESQIHGGRTNRRRLQWKKKFRKYWSRSFAGFAVITILLLVSAYFYIGNGKAKPIQDKTSPKLTNKILPITDYKAFTIDDILEGKFAIEESTFHFIEPSHRILDTNEDPGYYYTVEDGKQIVIKQLYDKTFRKEVEKSAFWYEGEEYTIQHIEISYRLDKAIFATNLKKEFRHSSKGLYWIKDLDVGDIKPLSPFPQDIKELTTISFAKFSPNFNYLYLAYKNNLYIQNIYNDMNPRQITNDGSEEIFNGKPDWIYEEEVLASDNAVWWSPDDSKFVFAKFDDTEVESYAFPKYTTHENYPPLSTIKYSKPGYPNPKVSLYMFDITQGVLYSVNYEGKESSNDSVLYDASWIDAENFLFKVSDRESRLLKILVFNAHSNKLYTPRILDANTYSGWIEKMKKILIIPPNASKYRDSTGYVDVHPDSDGYNHLFYYNSALAQTGKQLTKGHWEITGEGIVGYEYATDTIFYLANEIGPMSQHLYATTIYNNAHPEIITTLQNPAQMDDFYTFTCSSSGRYALMKIEGPGIPGKYAGSLPDLLQTDSLNSESILKLSNDKKLRETLNKCPAPTKSYKSMTLDDGVTINYIEIKPAKMETSKQYPLLVNIYGGPGSQTFTTKFSVQFEAAVVSGLEAIVLQIEPRGTGGKGWQFKSWARENIGYWEPRDITDVTQKFLEMNKEHIDKDKIAIWGWSYGGFTTLKTIEYDAGNTFKYAMAVAPVTNWRYYDSIYTERYMLQPFQNNKGYNEVSLVREVQNFANLEKFLLVHGTADDNVHIQNTYELVDNLNLLNVENYEMYIFPDSDHSIRYHHADKAVYRKLYKWLSNAFSVH